MTKDSDFLPHESAPDEPPITRPPRNSAPPALLTLGLVLVALNLRPVISGFGPLLGRVQSDLGISASTISLLTSVPLLCWGIFALLAPRLARWRSAEVLILGCTLLVAAGAGPNLPVMLLGTVLVGVGIAVINVLLPSLIRRDFPEKLGQMTGLYTAAVVTGAAISSGLAVPLAQSLGSWRHSLLLWAALALLGALSWLPALFGRPPRTASRGGQQVGGNVWSNPVTLPLTLFMGLQSVVFFSWLTWLPKILQDGGLPASRTGYLLSLGNIIQLPFSLFVPVLASRLGSVRGLLLGMSAALALGILGLLLWPSAPVLWIALLGIGSGSAFPLALFLVAQRARSITEVPQLSAISQGFGYLIAATGPFILGFVHDFTGQWSAPLLVMLALTGLMCVAGLWVASVKPAQQQE